MLEWYKRGILQVIDNESGITLLEIETIYLELEKTSFNFDKCDYQFIDLDCDEVLLSSREIFEIAKKHIE